MSQTGQGPDYPQRPATDLTPDQWKQPPVAQGRPPVPQEPPTLEPDHSFADRSQLDEFGGQRTSTERQDTAQAAKQEAGRVAEQAKHSGKQVAATAKTEADRVVDEAKTQARSLLAQSRQEVREQASGGKDRLTTNLRAWSDELDSIGREGLGDGPVSRLLGDLNSRGHNAAQWLETHDVDDVVAEVGRFARRRPLAFMLIAGGLGLVAGRFARGLREEQADTRHELGAPGPDYREGRP